METLIAMATLSLIMIALVTYWAMNTDWCQFCRHGCIHCNNYDEFGLANLMPDGGHVGYQKWAKSPYGKTLLDKRRELRERRRREGGWPRTSL